MPTHYDVLGLSVGATAQEIREAYRRLAREVHPDVNKAPDAKERFQRVQAAYEALRDPARRAAYDAILRGEHLRDKAPPDAKDAERRRKAKEEEDRLRRVAEERMRDAPSPFKIDLEETQRLTRLLNQGRLVDAERLAMQMLLKESRQPVPYAVLGDIARARGEYEKAMRQYGYAAQYEPRNPVYERKYEEMMKAEAPSATGTATRYVPQVTGPPLAIGGFLTALMALYVALSPEKPLGLAFAPAWTLGTMSMLFLAGIVAGACLSAAGVLARFEATAGSALMRVPPATALGLVSIVSFWVACLVYFLIGQTQQAFNRSLSGLLGAVALLTVAFAFAGWARGPDLALQNLVWGGNLAYFGSLAGWFVTDSLRTR